MKRAFKNFKAQDFNGREWRLGRGRRIKPKFEII